MTRRMRGQSRERWWHRLTLVVLWVLLAAFALREWSRYGPDVLQWDLMLLSGLAVFLVGAYVAHPLPRRLDGMLIDLARRQVLVAPESALQDLARRLRRQRQRWRRHGGLVCALAIALAFAAVLLGSYSPAMLGLGVMETLIAFLAGRYLGAMAHACMLSRALERGQVRVVARPGALDGAGGLRAIGDYFFLQASVVSLPAVYLAAWLVLIPMLDRYQHWVQPYCGLLLVALVFVVLAFVLPLWAFHREMRAQKRAYAARADEIAARINALRDQLLAEPDQETRHRLQDTIDAESRLYREIDGMPTWPIARVTLRRFSINNTVLSFPLVAQGLDQLGVGGEILRWLASLAEA